MFKELKATRSKKIVLIDDDEKDIELTMLVLSECQLSDNVFVIRKGEEVLDYLISKGKYAQKNNGLPSLIILDLKMPKMDGFEIIKAIKNHNELKQIPIVVFSSSPQISDITKCYDLGVNSYIIKPIDFNEFYQALENIGKYWLSFNVLPYKF